MSDNFKTKIDQLIINSPFTEPAQFWEFDKTKGKFHRQPGRRKAGYVIASGSKKYQEPGDLIDLPLVNKIRPRVKNWRENNYPGVTAISKRLLEFWSTKEADGRMHEFFFCQKEAIETLIWWREAPANARVGIDIRGDGGEFERLCCKMATGTGKTFVMAMTIAWQILNKISYPQDARFTKNVFIIAPNLTVKSRLQVLDHSGKNNYYELHKIVPHDLLPKLRQGKILIKNWHALMWDDEDKLKKRKHVDKRGAKSDEAYVREVLEDMARASSLLVINDEAHHAWRHRREDKRLVGVDKNEIKMATCWLRGLDRIHKARRIVSCFDFSATPFSPSGTKGRKSYEEDLFNWIVSDFGLMDAIEAGLTKTPRFVVRDDAPVNPKNYKSKLYHIYDDEDVKANLNRKATATEILPALVKNAYLLLGFDWQKTLAKWEKSKMFVPPVMISAVNRTETADRIEHMFTKKRIPIDGLSDENKTLAIHSNLDDYDKKQDKARAKANSVGQTGGEGEQIRHVISVAMLSEGWDCHTVTHIMGLRAFSSQLLCEQVVGRGLRRTSYELNSAGMFDAEYVNIFGIPLSYIPQEDCGEGIPRPPSPRVPIFPDSDKKQYEITWPNVERIDYHIRSELKVNFDAVEPLEIVKIRKIADLAPEIDGQPDYEKIDTIDLEKLVKQENKRLQEILLTVTVNVYDQINSDWKKKVTKGYAIQQLFDIVEKFISSDKLKVEPKSFAEDETRKKIAIMMGMEQIVRKIFSVVTQQNHEELVPIYRNPRYRSTADALEWRTAKKEPQPFKKNHMNLCVFDSAWEMAHAKELDRNPAVIAWVKNDHLGFEIPYVHGGALRSYQPDFIVKLGGDNYLILEVKGLKKDRDESKWDFVKTWTRAVSQDTENGKWHFAVSQDDSGRQVHETIRSIVG